MEISAIIIGKNEEAKLGNAIASLMEICNQIVYLDTGSTDKSAVIASSLGCDVHFQMWENDFSKARNYALDFARGEWVIALDADETFDTHSFIKYAHLLSKQEIGGISCKIINYLDEKLATSTSHRYTRIFRNHRNIRYKGAIHEQISESILENGFEIAEADLIILHYGYINSSEEKKLRNKTILSQELEKNTDEPWLKYHLAATEFSLHNLKRAKELYFEIVNSDKLSNEQKETVAIRLMQIALSNDDFDYIEMNESFEFANSDYEGLKLFILSALYLKNNNYKKALEVLERSAKYYSSLVDKQSLRRTLEALKEII